MFSSGEGQRGQRVAQRIVFEGNQGRHHNEKAAACRFLRT